MLLLPLLKKCTVCKINKTYNHFSKNKSQKDGMNYRCSDCCKEYGKKYYIKNANSIIKKNKEYYIKNIDKLKQYANQNNKQYRIDNPEKCKENDKKQRIKNADKRRQSDRQYIQTENGKLKRKVQQHKRCTLKKTNTPIGKHFTSADIILKLKLQKNKCVYCKKSIKKYYEIDHFIPISKGGTNEASNIQLLCAKCNGMSGKGSKLPTEFAKDYNMLL